MAKGKTRCAPMLSMEVERYLLAIRELSSGGYAKTNDLARELGVKSPSVTEMLAKLSSRGLVEYERYKGAKLTKSGYAVANEAGRRKEIFGKFLKRIFVSPEIAEKDAGRMEHNLDMETLRQLSKLVVFLDSFENTPCLFKCFGVFCRTGKIPLCSMKGEAYCNLPRSPVTGQRLTSSRRTLP